MISPASVEARPKIPAFSWVDFDVQLSPGEDIFAEIPRAERRRIERLLKKAIGRAEPLELFSIQDYFKYGGRRLRNGLSEENMQSVWDHMGWGPRTWTTVESAKRNSHGEIIKDRNGRTQWFGLHNDTVTRENIAEFRKVRMAGPRYSAILAVESDDPKSLKELERFIGAPNLVAIRNSTEEKENGKISRPGQWHAIWLLRNPVLHENPDRSETKALTKYRAVQKTITHLTGGDPSFTRGVMRSPFHDDQDYDWYWLHSQKYRLDDLAEACQRSGYSVHRARYLLSGHQKENSRDQEVTGQQALPLEGQQRSAPKEREQAWIARVIDEGRDFDRNPEVFGRLSRRATAWRHQGKPVQRPDLMERAEHLNALLAEHSPKGPMTQQELKGIVSSVFRWGPNAATRQQGWEPATQKHQGPLNALRAAGVQLYGGLFTYEQCCKGGATTWRLHTRRLLKVILVKARRKSMEIRRAQRNKKMEKIWTLHLEGLTGAEIIAVTGIPKSTVYRLLSVARQIEEDEAERRERDERQIELAERESEERSTASLRRSSIPLTKRSTNETPQPRPSQERRAGPAEPSSSTTSASLRASDASRFSLKLLRRTRKAARRDAEDALAQHSSA